MKDCSREGHEITITQDGIGYCRHCDDWHDLDSLRPASPPARRDRRRPQDDGLHPLDRVQLRPDAG